MTAKKVAIIGLGWLGMPLAEHLAQNGWQVKGTKRQYLTHSAIEIFPFELNHIERTDLVQLLNVDALIITIPPNKISPEAYLAGCKGVVQRAILQEIPHLIFISTTGIFPQRSGIFDEYSPTDLSHCTSQLEQWLLAQPLQVDILRLAGLIGENRHPVYHLAGKKALSRGNQPVNLVHQIDCIRAIELLLNNPNGTRIFHLVAPHHPSRQTYYSAMAEKLGLPDLQFLADNRPLVRLITGNKICHQLGFTYRYPDPFEMV